MFVTDEDYLFQLAFQMATVACVCLEQTTLGVPAHGCWVDFGRSGDIPDDCCDYLAVSIERIYPTSSFPNPDIGVVDNCKATRTAADFVIRLARRCALPVLKNDPNNPFPEREDTQAGARQLYEDARVLHCCFRDQWATAAAFPQRAECTDIAWGEMIPFRQADCAGWEWRFTVEIGSCCISDTLPPLPPAAVVSLQPQVSAMSFPEIQLSDTLVKSETGIHIKDGRVAPPE